ncbi:MAG: PKD domain-containing protein [Xanthomonadales bacterium]|nr:PKD domain-containing protein [Xanthomonadales bacterium]
MKIRFRDGQWRTSEVITTDTLGYGTYRWDFASRVDQFDPNVVLGLFTWDSAAPAENYREIDIEFAKWGDAGAPDNSQYVVQPYDTAGNLQRFNTVLTGSESSHEFTWHPDRVEFDSHQGLNLSGPEIFSWSYTGPDVPPEGAPSANARINVWLQGGNAPLDSQEVEVIVEAFTFLNGPTASFSHSTDNLEATFTDTSTDPDGTIVSWNWDFGDPSTSSDTSTAQNPVYTYAAAGTYNVFLEVTDDEANTDSVTIPVTVSEYVPPCTSSKAIPANQWIFFSLPCMPPGHQASTVFSSGPQEADYGSRWIIYTYNNAVGGGTPAYETLGAAETLNSGQGYLVYSLDAHTLEVEGEFNTVADVPLLDDAVNPPNDGVWNLVGNMHTGDVDWTDVIVDDNEGAAGVNFSNMDKLRGGTYDCEKTPDVHNSCSLWHVMYKYVSGSYQMYDGTGADSLSGWEAMWVRSHRADSISLPAAASDPPLAQAVADVYDQASAPSPGQLKKGGKGKGGGKRSGWAMELIAAATDLRDSGNMLGQRSDAKDGLDARDLEEWVPHASPYLTILFINPLFPPVEWGYSRDLRGNSGAFGGSWDFVVRASSGVSEVTLSWTGDELAFGNAVLTDLTTGQQVQVMPGGVYTFDVISSAHPFSLSVE